MNEPPCAIEIEDIKKGYKSQGGRELAVLDMAGEAVRIGRGELVLVLGPNGSGKTTLLHLVAGLLRPDKGRILVLQRDLTLMSEKELDGFRAARIGYVLQGQRLIDWLTAEENVAAALLFAGRADSSLSEHTAKLMQSIGLGERLKHLPTELSGGERQKVAMARALACDPDILLADEPTAGLDKDAASWVAERIAAFCKNMGKTALVVTHEPDLFPGASRVLELNRGRLVSREPGQ